MKKALAGAFGAALFALATLSPATAIAGGNYKGEFTGKSDHITTGGVTVVKTAGGGAVVILDKDFSLDGAPDPRVGFGKDGTYSDAADLGPLQNIGGMQVYIVPASVNVHDFNEVYIWCKQFSVPLGVASISK